MKKTLRVISVVLLLFTAVSAFFGGWTMISAPDGSTLQMPAGWLENSPFSSYLVPGIILFVVNGALSLFTAITIIFNMKIYPLMLIFQGMVLCGWIIAQISIIRMLSWLQFVFIITGMFLFLLGLLLANAEKTDKGKIVTA